MPASELVDRCGRVGMEQNVDVRFLRPPFQHAVFHCRCALELATVINNQKCLDASIQESVITLPPLAHVVVSAFFQFQWLSKEVDVRIGFWFIIACMLCDYSPELTQCDW